MPLGGSRHVSFFLGVHGFHVIIAQPTPTCPAEREGSTVQVHVHVHSRDRTNLQSVPTELPTAGPTSWYRYPRPPSTSALFLPQPLLCFSLCKPHRQRKNRLRGSQRRRKKKKKKARDKRNGRPRHGRRLHPLLPRRPPSERRSPALRRQARPLPLVSLRLRNLVSDGPFPLPLRRDAGSVVIPAAGRRRVRRRGRRRAGGADACRRWRA